MIVKPEKMNFANKNLFLILSGLPGTGKTTLACSLPHLLLIDTDKGICRINPAHRKDASICKTYEEILADIKAAEGNYETIAIDTAGALIEYMKDWAVRTDPKASKNGGGISLQGYGIVKQEFLRLCNELCKKFNVIFIFHEQIENVGEDSRYSIVCEGATKSIVFQPSDLAAHLFIQNGQRYLGFTPTEQYTAKGAYGIKGLIPVPELKDGQSNTFLADLFAQVRANLKSEGEKLTAEKKEYDEVMAWGLALIDGVDCPENVKPALDAINAHKHALTSKQELLAALKDQLERNKITYDKATKTYVQAPLAAV